MDEELTAPYLSDGMNKFYTMDMGIRQLFSAKKMAGPAVTVKCSSGDNLALHKSFEYIKPGDVLVVETQGAYSHAVCGDIMVSVMIKLGVAGLIVDGCIRDIETIKNMGMPVFARGTICGAGHKDGPGEVNFPIACGGIVVNPGDLVFGDENGVVCIPQDDIEEAIAGAEKKLSQDNKRCEEIAQGKLMRPGLDDILRAKGVIK
jgi:RraA family protein